MNRLDIKSLLANPIITSMRIAFRNTEKLDTLQREISHSVMLHERRARLRRGRQ